MNKFPVSKLRELMTYNPDNGQLRWRGRACVKDGKIVGSSHSAGYIQFSVFGCRLFAHRAAFALMTGKWPKGQIDHINGDRSDNRWINLREASQHQNSANMRRRPNNKSGYKGVVAWKKKWAAFIHVEGKTRYLGLYESPQKAHAAYLKAAKKFWNEYARAA